MKNVKQFIPKEIRNRMATVIGTSFGLFLALRYNSFISELIQSVYPIGTGLGEKFFLIAVLTVIIVYIIVFVEGILK